MGRVLYIPPNKYASQNSTAVIVYTFKDPDGTVVPRSNVVDATLNMYDPNGSAIGDVDRDVLTDLHSTSGLFRYIVPATDNIIVATVETDEQFENHVAKVIFNFSVGSETHRLTKNFLVRVENNPHHTD